MARQTWTDRHYDRLAELVSKDYLSYPVIAATLSKEFGWSITVNMIKGATYRLRQRGALKKAAGG